jgi:hypothetical protein
MSNYLGYLEVEAEILTVGKPPDQYTFPSADGLAGDVLMSEGDGNLVFSAGASDDHTQLINIGVNTHESLDAFKSDVEAKVDQDVRAQASPSFRRVTVGSTASTSSVLALDANTSGAIEIKFSTASSGLPQVRYQLRYAADRMLLIDAAGGQPIFDTEASNFNVLTGLTVADGKNLQLGRSSNIGNTNCVTMLFNASTAIEKGRCVKIVDNGGLAQIRKFGGADADGIGLIGVTGQAGAINTDISVCIVGVFEASVQAGLTVSIGEHIEKSDNEDFRNAGRVVGLAAASIGTFGVALTTVTGNTAGTVYVKGIYIKNETF